MTPTVFFSIVNSVLSIFTACGLLALAYGYRSHILVKGSVVYHFAIGVVVTATVFACQRLYWDVAFNMMEQFTPETWARWRALTGGPNINIVFNAMMLIGAYHSLVALHLLIPDNDRARWRWWSAWAYPGHWCLSRKN